MIHATILTVGVAALSVAVITIELIGIVWLAGRRLVGL